jgi:hypothetical protein
MKMVDRLSLLALPRVLIAGFAIGYVPSALPRDSIADLVSALLVVAQSGAPSVVRWNEEAQESDLCVERAQDRAAWTLCRLQPISTGEVERHGEGALEGSVAAMIRPFWKALRDLQTRYAPEEYAKRWYHPFPARDLEQLTTWVHAQKA